MVRIRLLLLAAWVLLPALATAAPLRYESFFVFGDSLSDPGNAYFMSGNEWPISPPYAQRFSNGRVAAELLADRLGITMTPAAAGGTNFAVGGATTGLKNYNFEVGSPAGLPAAFENSGISAQVAGFLAAAPEFDPNGSLFMLWGGPNDIFLGLAQSSNMSAVIGDAIANLSTSILTLAGAGAIDFLVPNMPNLALTPFGLAQSEANRNALNAISLGFNDALAQALAQVRSLAPTLNLFEFDVASFLQNVLFDPAAYGFTNVTETCFLAASCDSYLFFDPVHPTTAAHALLAKGFAQRIPEPSLPSLLLVALLAAGLARYARGRRSLLVRA